MPSSTTVVLTVWLLKLNLTLFAALLACRGRSGDDGSSDRIQIVVLGDIGRSPRMQYHAISAANKGWHVSLVGYEQSKLHPDASMHDSIEIVPLLPTPSSLNTRNRILFLIFGPLKAVLQVWSLWSALYVRSHRSRWMIVQNPPSIPTLAVACLICRLRGTSLVIDWHNFGYTILSLKLGPNHPLVNISRLYERILGCYASAHLCVTDALSRVLKERLPRDSKVLTLHDRPASIFQPLNDDERLAFLKRLEYTLNTETSNSPFSTFCGYTSNPDYAFATTLMGAIESRAARLLVSSTSWTPDEDFDILLNALAAHSQAVHTPTDDHTCKLFVFITGKGPGRASFEHKLRQYQAAKELPQVHFVTGYFDNIKDYASLLACADVGISLHTSSSGLDLPMKVLDMFGAGVPVVGWSDFEAWPELVKEGHNGLGFRNSKDLQHILRSVLGTDSRLLKRLRQGAVHEGRRGWDDEWTTVCGRLFEHPNAGNGESRSLPKRHL